MKWIYFYLIFYFIDNGMDLERVIFVSYVPTHLKFAFQNSLLSIELKKEKKFIVACCEMGPQRLF